MSLQLIRFSWCASLFECWNRHGRRWTVLSLHRDTIRVYWTICCRKELRFISLMAHGGTSKKTVATWRFREFFIKHPTFLPICYPTSVNYLRCQNISMYSLSKANALLKTKHVTTSQDNVCRSSGVRCATNTICKVTHLLHKMRPAQICTPILAQRLAKARSCLSASSWENHSQDFENVLATSDRAAIDGIAEITADSVRRIALKVFEFISMADGLKSLIDLKY